MLGLELWDQKVTLCLGCLSRGWDSRAQTGGGGGEGGGGGGDGEVLLTMELLIGLATVSCRVAVKVTTQLAIPPAAARSEFLDYAWARGGGLPLLGVTTGDAASARTLVPLFLRERLVDNDLTLADGESVSYVVTDPGPILGLDVVPGTHSAQVTFTPANDGSATTMDWKVAFEARARKRLWELVTRTTVGEVSANLAAR